VASGPSPGEIERREAHRDRGLTRGIGTVALALATVNAVVGAGIFSLPAGMAKAAGPYALVAYLICAIVMGAVVLCCAVAGSRAPTSGGIYGYVDAAFGPLAGFVAGVLLWLSCVLAAGGIASALAAALAKLVPELGSAGPRAAIIIAVISVLAAINCYGVKAASRFLALSTAIKLIPLALFIGAGVLFLDPAKLASGALPGVEGIGRAVILSLFAFQGMETALGASGEVRDPARTLPRALIAAMIFVAVLYVAIQVVAQGLLGGALAASTAPLADALAVVDPRLGLVILIGTALSMGIWLGSDLLGAPRVLFAFARDGFLPSAMGSVSAKTQAPTVAIVVHALFAIGLAITGTFEQLTVLSVLAGCTLYIGACLAAWRLTRQEVAMQGPPLRLPALGALAALGVVGNLAAIALARPAEIAGLIAAIAASCAVYWLTRGARARRA
jgi:amino acid transporter